MDWLKTKETVVIWIRKYRFILLVLLLGGALMLLPQQEEAPAQPAQEQEAPSLEKSLEGILSQIHGAGKVRVLLTQAAGEQIFYQTDEDHSASADRSDTVLVSEADRTQTGLIRQRIAPVYQGALIVCQGAEDPKVRLNIVEAVKSVTGLGADHISVVKMK